MGRTLFLATMAAVGYAAWILPGGNGGNPTLVLTAISAAAVIFATLWLIRPSYILAALCLEGRMLACRLTHEGGVFTRKNVWVFFYKQNPDDWKGWPFHAFQETKFSAGTISGKTERIYNLKPIHESYDKERGFLPPIVCEVSWKTLFRRVSKEYVLYAEDAEGLSFERLGGIDYFVDENRPVLQKMMYRAATVLRFIDERGGNWREQWDKNEEFRTLFDAVQGGKGLETKDKEHALHDQFFHEPGGPHFGECPEEIRDKKMRVEQERRLVERMGRRKRGYKGRHRRSPVRRRFSMGLRRVGRKG